MNRTVLFGPFPPPQGGVASFVESLGDALRVRGIGFTSKPYRHPAQTSEDVRQTFTSVVHNFRQLGRGDTCIDSSSFFLEYPDTYASVAWLALSLRQFRWVKVLHDATLPSRFSTFTGAQRLLVRAATKRIDMLVAVSETLRTWAVEVLGISADRTRTIGSLLPLPSEAESFPEVLRDMFFGAGDMVVTTIGCFTPEYGLDTLADAMEGLRRETGKPLPLLVLDPGFNLNAGNSFRDSVLSGRSWIRVVTGLPRRDVLAVLRRSAVFVRPTRFESVGLSRIEALMSGTPVIATPVGETRGMRLVPVGDSEALARALTEVLGADRAATAAAGEFFRDAARRNLEALMQTVFVGAPA